MIRGLDPMRIVELLQGHHPRRLGPGRHRQLPPLHPRDRLADAARHRLRDGHRSSTARPAPATRTPTRPSWSTSATAPPPGRRERGVRLRGELPDPAGLLPAEQPLGHLGAGGSAVAHPAVPARPADSASRRCRSTATTCSPATPSPRRVARGRPRGRGPRLIEALTYRMGAHTTADDPTKYRDRGRAGVLGRPRPDRPLRDVARGRRGDGRRLLRRRRRPRRRTSPPTSARRTLALEPPDDEADLRPRLQRAASGHHRADGSGSRTTNPPSRRRLRRSGARNERDPAV